MKKTSLFALALALILAGCSDSDNNSSDEGKQGGEEVDTDGGKTDGGKTDGGKTDGGKTDGGKTDGGKTDPDSGKTDPDSGKTDPDSGKTDPDSGKTDPDSGKTDECKLTFKYTNIDTCVATGGEKDLAVYLFGEMNSWTKSDPAMAMTADGGCVRTISIDTKVGDTYKYKFYVDGWGDDSYRSDPNKCDGEDCNNVVTVASCGQVVEFNDKVSGGSDDPGHMTEGDCQATFTYYNQWTNVASGGAADWDVYLVGSMNNWAQADPALKMTSNGNGTHSITVNLKQGETYEYKFYVSGWADDSWKTIEEDGQSNAKATLDTCGKNFGNADPVSTDPGTNPGQKTEPDEDGNCLATFTYVNKYTNKASGGDADWDVYLIGEMNNWAQADSAMKMTSDGNGTHTITLNLDHNKNYKYKFYINGWENDSWRANYNSCADNDCNSEINMSTCNQNVKFVDVPLGNGDSGNTTPFTPTDGSISLAKVPSVNDKEICIELNLKDGVTVADVTRNSVAMNVEVVDGKFCDTVSDNNKYAYTIKGSDGSELYVPVWVEDKAFDWHDALLYFAFTDRFVDGDASNNYNKGEASRANTSDANWLGGDFKGMKDKVEAGYFDKLGVNTLWISSVSMNAQGLSAGTGADTGHYYSAYHSYWPVASFYTDNIADLFNGKSSEGVSITPIEPHFGTLDDLKALVDACHKRGIRVLVDFAANQVHKDSPVFQAHPDWFNDVNSPWLCDNNNGWDNYSEKCWFSQDLPDINYENGDARRAMVDHAVWLIKTTNIDGFRVDAVKHMNIQFIKDLRAATNALFANTGSMFYMVGETFTGDVGLLNKYIGDDLLHAQFDFPMYYALQSHILGLGNYASVAQQNSYFNSDLMGTFMGNHDVARAISVAAGQNQNKWGSNQEITDWLPYLKVKTAWTILLTNPGVPLIYYGDEYGMEGSNDPDNRRMMEFDDTLNNEQKGMLGYVQLLGQIRKSHPAITRGHRENLSYGGGYWCYKLTGAAGSDVIVGIARADGGDNSGCSLGGQYTLRNLLSDAHETITVDGLNLSENRLQVYEVL